MTKLKIFAITGLFLTLNACGNKVEHLNYVDFFSSALPSSSESSNKITPQDIRERLTPELVAHFRGAPLLIVSMENLGISSILYGVGQNGDVVTYFTPDQVSLSFSDGILVATRGLGFDLMFADVSGRIADLHSNGGIIERTHTTLSGDEILVNELFVCKVVVQPNGDFTERCMGQDYSFQNTYEFDSYGKMVRSRQWISPERGYIVVESL